MTPRRERVDRIMASLLGRPAVVTIRVVLEAYGAAGGGLLAGGLAYSGLLAVLSACLLVVGLTGFIVSDPARQAALVADLGTRVPPLAGLLQTGLDRVVEGAVAFSIVGLLGLAWSTGRFYGDLDSAFARVFAGVRQRSLIARLARGIALAGLLILTILGSVLLGTVTALADQILPVDAASVARSVLAALLAVAPVLLYVASVGAIYRWVPPRTVRWRHVGRPALVVALALALLSNLFVFLQGRLLGALELFSGFVVVLATMIWLSLGFQLLLLGAAWVRVRQRDAELAEVGPGA